MTSGLDKPFTLDETHGLLQRPEHSIARASDRLGWRSLYASHQFEAPYADHFDARADHLVIVHFSGPVSVERDLNGERDRQKIGSGGLFILPPDLEFGVALLQPLETVHLYVRARLVQAAAEELCKGDPQTIDFIPRLGEHDALIEQLARMARTMLTEEQSDFFADGVARLLAAQLVRHHSTGMEAPQPRVTGLNSRQSRAVREVIEERMHQPLSIDDLAAAAHLSPIHFARQFKRTSGKAPHQFLIEMRLARARDLLAGELPIVEIAFRCGFSHQEHLTRLFGRRYGSTPAAYRRTLKA